MFRPQKIGRAIAYATELAHEADPITCNLDVEQMQGHVLHCIESGLLTRFPQLHPPILQAAWVP